MARSEKQKLEKLDMTSEPAGSAGAARTSRPVAKAPQKNIAARGIEFCRECWAELGRVQWPDRRQLWQATAVVIVVCLIVGFYIGALDRIFRPLSGWLIDQYAKH